MAPAHSISLLTFSLLSAAAAAGAAGARHGAAGIRAPGRIARSFGALRGARFAAAPAAPQAASRLQQLSRPAATVRRYMDERDNEVEELPMESEVASTSTGDVAATEGGIRFEGTPSTITYEKDFPQVVDEAASLAAANFPISQPELINKAKDFFSSNLAMKPEIFADDFNFMGPVVGPLPKKEFLNSISTFDFHTAFPDANGQYYHFRIDPFEPNRVWCTSRSVGTHTGTFGGFIPATGKQYASPPQALSVKFNEAGLVEQMTVGYVMDRAIGNQGGLGGIFGILYAIGHPLPFREAQPWKKSFRYKLFSAIGNLRSAFKKSAKKNKSPAQA